MTNTHNELLGLAERVEGATGPDRSGLNNEVAKAMGWHRVEPRHTRGKHGAWIAPEDFLGVGQDGRPRLDSLHGTTMHREPPAFLTSLDAAMTLVPEGAAFRLYHWPRQTEGARACALVEGGQETWAATPALALTASCLRAHASLREGTGR